ncbi:MAG: OmpA family protein [Bacteroidia bacterium]|nr:OmpA family protein [Bacteroidia bacterium]
MKKLTKLTLAIAASLTISATGFSQKALTKADQAFDAQQYYHSIELYKDAIQKVDKTKQPLVYYKMGMAAEKINLYKESEGYLQKSIAGNFDNPEVYFHLGNVLKAQMKYDEAIVEYNNYKSKGGDARKADLSVNSSKLAQQWVDNPMRYKVENMSFNSKGRDYAPCYSDKKYATLLISSNKDGSLGERDLVTGNNHSDLWETKLDKNGKWSSPVILPPAVSTPVNEGRGWVSKKGDMIFYMRCPEEKDKQNKGGLYLSKKQGSTWGPGEILPFCADSVIYGDPCLSSDGKTLYFSSNMSGGYGGSDIWYCSYDAKSNSWGQPKNAGSTVNTAGSERYPTITDDGKKLYFSSNYHPGLGGYDMFVTEIGADGKTNKPVENLKYPMNSSFDDFGIIFEGKRDRGYFTSNREGGKGDDDIYSFMLPALQFFVTCDVRSAGDPNTGVGRGEPVENVKVKIVGTDGSINEMMTGKDGVYKFKLKAKQTYTITIETTKNSRSASNPNSGFLANKDAKVVTTVGVDKSTTFEACFVGVIPIVKDPRMPEVRYATGQYTLMPEAKDSLNFLYNIMKDNPTTVVELNSHTDTRGNAVSNMTLSAARAQSCVDYLVKEKGIDSKRLTAKGYGLTMPIIPDSEIAKAKTKEEKEALHAKNRRTSFKILSFDFVDPNAPKAPAKGAGNKGGDDGGDEE